MKRRGTVPVRLRITAAVITLVALALVGVGVAFYALQLQRIDATAADEVAQELNEFDSFVESNAQPSGDAETVLRQFLQSNFPARDEIFIGHLLDGQPSLTQGDRFADVVDDPAYQAAVERLLPRGGSLKTRTRFGDTVVAVDAVRDSDGGTPGGALVIASFTRDDHQELLRTMQVATGVGVLALVIVSGGAWVVAGRLLRPVRELQAAAQTITETNLTRRIEARGNDDLTALTRTFNAMIDRLEDAFLAQRQFLDDAGHELRTPITVVRGHLELLDVDDPTDVAQTTDLVIDEVDRMSRLVDDLILLARSQRPDFLRPDWLDLAQITDELADKMRGLGDRSWTVDHRGNGVLFADRQRITQAVLQLANNAVRHTDLSDTIAIGSRATGREIHLWIRDTGRGIPVEHQESIFERFHQVDTSGRRGTGLGLSIVRAIALAHHGSVRVRSTVGRGSTFTLALPTGSGGGRHQARPESGARPTVR